MALKFDKYAQEGNYFIRELADKYGHPEETARAGIVLRAVLHTLRDRITISESLDLLSQLPMFLKAVYVENWKYHEKPMKYDTAHEFKTEVKKRQVEFGEQEFEWNKSTDELIRITMEALNRYISKGQAKHVVGQLPNDIKALFVDEP